MMWDIPNNYKYAAQGLGPYIEDIQKLLHKRVLGFDLFYMVIPVGFFILFLTAYFIISGRLNRTRKKVRTLERQFENFREEINAKIASIKIQKVDSPLKTAKAESLIDEMLAANEGVERKTEISKVGTREGSAPAKQTHPPEAKAEQTPKIPDEQSKDSGMDVSGEIDDLLNGLKDATNPYLKGKGKGSKPPGVEVGDPRVGWDDKTILKSDEEVSAVDLEGAELLEEEGTASEEGDKGTEVIFDKPDKVQTKVDGLEGDAGKLESPDRVDEYMEPHKTIDIEGHLEERRSHERVEDKNINLEIIYEGFTDFIKECSVNISKGGIFIKSPKTHPVGSIIKLDIRLKDGYTLIKAQGEIVRVEPPDPNKPENPGGMGVKFLSFEGDSEKLIEKIIEQRKATKQ